MTFAARLFFLSILGGIWVGVDLLHPELGVLGLEILIIMTGYFFCLGCFAGRIFTEYRRRSSHLEQESFWAKLFFISIFIVAWITICNYTNYEGQVICSLVFIFLTGGTLYSTISQIVRYRKTDGRFRTVKTEEIKAVEIPDNPEQVVRQGKQIEETSRGKLWQWNKNSDVKVIEYYDKKLNVRYVEFVLPDVSTVDDAFRKKWQLRDSDDVWFTEEA